MDGSDNIRLQMEDALRKKGVRLTPQRQEIIRLLAGEENHPSARMLLEKVRSAMPRVSTSTVYYTLGLLKKEGLVKELEFTNMENRYETRMTGHIDLFCEKCGAIENFDEDLSEVPFMIEDRTGFKSRKMRYEYYGLCRNCREKT